LADEVETFGSGGADGYDLAAWSENIGAGCTIDEDAEPSVGETGDVLNIVAASSGFEALAVRFFTTRVEFYLYTKFYVVSHGLPSGESMTVASFHSTGGQWIAALLVKNNGGQLQARIWFDEDIDAQEAVVNISAGQWYEAEWYIKADAAPGSDVFQGVLDGVSVIEDVAANIGEANIGKVELGVPAWEGDEAIQIYFDHLEVRDAGSGWKVGPSAPSTEQIERGIARPSIQEIVQYAWR